MPLFARIYATKSCDFRNGLNLSEEGEIIESLFETFFSLTRDGKSNKSATPNILRTALILFNFKNEIRLDQPNRELQKIVFMLLRQSLTYRLQSGL